MATATEVTLKKHSRTALTAKLAEEIGLTNPAPKAPEEARERAAEWWDEYKAQLLGACEGYLTRLRKRRGPTNGHETGFGVDTYVAWDIMTISPLELTGSPIYQPDKVVPGGEWVQILAVMWTNPEPDIPHGFAVPPTTQLAGRGVRVALHQLNLTTGAAVAPQIYSGPLPASPQQFPSLIGFGFKLQVPTVTNPELFEVNITADIIDLGQPYAAFSTWHRDLDADPPWSNGFPGDIPANLMQHDIPLRFMVYPQ
jgi:hypothetical protein